MVTGATVRLRGGQELGIVNDDLRGATTRRVHRAGAGVRRAVLPAEQGRRRRSGRIKRAVQTGAEVPFETALALERELQQQLFQSDDAKEGLAAYVEKRKAEFKGADLCSAEWLETCSVFLSQRRSRFTNHRKMLKKELPI